MGGLVLVYGYRMLYCLISVTGVLLAESIARHN
jgi:hypothetical protein